jgi:hypothetical protein
MHVRKEENDLSAGDDTSFNDGDGGGRFLLPNDNALVVQFC